MTSDVAGAVREAKRGRIDFKIDKTSIVHVGLGKIDGVLRLLNLLLPPLSVNTGDNPTVTEREKLVLDQPELLQQFGMDILPVLVEVVSSGVNLNVCYGALSVINKMLYFSRSDMFPDLLEETNISSFLAGMFTRKDNHVLVLALCDPQDFLPETDFSTVSDYQRSLWKNLFCSLTVGLPHNLNSSTIYETLFLLKILEVLNKYPLHLMPHSLNSVSEERNGGVVNVER